MSNENETVPKIAIEINGKIYEDDEIENYAIFYEGGLTRISINLKSFPDNVDDPSNSVSIVDTSRDIPKMNEPYSDEIKELVLPANDMQKLNAMSNLRILKISEEDIGKKQSVEIESREFDIMNSDSILQAIGEVATKENRYFAQEFAYIQTIKPPTLVFKDGKNKFKLVEKIVIAQRAAVIGEIDHNEKAT